MRLTFLVSLAVAALAACESPEAVDTTAQESFADCFGGDDYCVGAEKLPELQPYAGTLPALKAGTTFVGGPFADHQAFFFYAVNPTAREIYGGYQVPNE